MTGMRAPRRNLRLIATGLALSGGLLLAGCTAPAPLDGSGDNPPAPEARIPIDCSQLASTDTLSGYFSAPVDSAPTSDPTLGGLSDAAILATGSLLCQWSSGPIEFGFPAEFLRLLVRPAAAAGFAEARAAQVDDGYTVFDSAGDASFSRCGSWFERWSCRGEVVIGDIWLTADLQASTSGALDESTVAQNIQATISRAADQLRLAQPAGTPWVAPAGSFDGDAVCGEASDLAAVGGAFGVTDPEREGYDTAFSDLWSFTQSGARECQISGPAGALPTVRISTLPGASWLLDQWKTHPPEAFGPGPVESAQAGGVGDVYVACADTTCVSDFAYGGSAVELSTQGLGRDELLASIGRLADVLDG
jgi:hypothetical protein